MVSGQVRTSQAPHVPMLGLQSVWFQITGTLCNLRCKHCFISCAPDNNKFEFMSADMVHEKMGQAVRLGAKEFYFTGGEPFMHPRIGEVLAAALELCPTTVLTNAMLFKESQLDHIARVRDRSPHPMTFRVSLDGYTADMNDALRGLGAFDAAMNGLEELVRRGFEPIVTVVRTWTGSDGEVLSGFVDTLRGRGYRSPQLKVLPSLKIGQEANRTESYPQCAKITHDMMKGYDPSQLLCSHTRLVTDRGVWVCPILLDSPDARMGDTLDETLHDYPLRHAACTTCYHNGAICSNSTTADSQPADPAASPCADGITPPSSRTDRVSDPAPQSGPQDPPAGPRSCDG